MWRQCPGEMSAKYQLNGWKSKHWVSKKDTKIIKIQAVNCNSICSYSYLFGPVKSFKVWQSAFIWRRELSNRCCYLGGRSWTIFECKINLTHNFNKTFTEKPTISLCNQICLFISTAFIIYKEIWMYYHAERLIVTVQQWLKNSSAIVWT